MENEITFNQHDFNVEESFSITPKLRWVERYEPHPDKVGIAVSYIAVLQQKWQGDRGSIRWEDVPLFKEGEDEQ